MTRFGATIAATLIVLGSARAAHARQTHNVGDGVPDSIRYYESVAMMSGAEDGSVGGAAGGKDVSFYTLGRQFDLKLEPNAVYAQGATVVWVDDAGVVQEPGENGGAFFTGPVDGDPTSWVRLSLRNGDLAGMISTAHEVNFLEPAARFFGAEATGETIAYRLSDTDSDWLPGSCAATAPRAPVRKRRLKSARTAAQRYTSMLGDVAGEVGSAAAAQLKRAQVGMVADFQYFSKHGAATPDDIAEIVNAVDGIYQSEVGVTIQIFTTVVYSTASDPFTETSDPNALLTEFTNWKNANDNSPGQLLYGVDFAHLTTGRDLASTVIGIAWMGSICSSVYGAGLSQDYTTATNLLTLLMAHEMGHNFGAPHDAQAGSACASEPATFIMNPVLSASLQQKFSGCSKTLINQEVASASCMDLVDPPPPPHVTLNPIALPLMVGGPVTLTGTGFTNGSVMLIFLATASGTQAYGPYTSNSHTSTTLSFTQLSASMPLGNGFGTVVVINTDQNFIQSNAQSQYVYGNGGLNVPTITGINGVSLRALDIGVPLASVETSVPQGSEITITGTGFNGAVVNLYTPTSAYPLTVKPGATSTRIQVDVPLGAPTGPGALQVINNPFVGNVVSNAVSVPIGAPLTLTSVTQSGNVITVHGTGFSPTGVINFFSAGMFIGGYNAAGQPSIPLNVISDTEFTFTIPAGAVTGNAYVQVINPPYIPFSSSGGDPDGAFYLVAPS